MSISIRILETHAWAFCYPVLFMDFWPDCLGCVKLILSWSVHYGKLGGTRRAFILATTKISHFKNVLYIYVQVKRGLDNWKPVAYLFTLNEGFWSHPEKDKKPIDNTWIVSALVPTVQLLICCIVTACSADAAPGNDSICRCWQVPPLQRSWLLLGRRNPASS